MEHFPLLINLFHKPRGLKGSYMSITSNTRIRIDTCKGKNVLIEIRYPKNKRLSHAFERADVKNFQQSKICPTILHDLHFLPLWENCSIAFVINNKTTNITTILDEIYEINTPKFFIKESAKEPAKESAKQSHFFICRLKKIAKNQCIDAIIKIEIDSEIFTYQVSSESFISDNNGKVYEPVQKRKRSIQKSIIDIDEQAIEILSGLNRFNQTKQNNITIRELPFTFDRKRKHKTDPETDSLLDNSIMELMSVNDISCLF